MDDKINARQGGKKMSTLRVGIAGMRRGVSFYKNFSKIEGAKVIAVMDPNEQVLEAFQKEYDVPQAFTSYEDMLDCGIDVVVIASPMPFHAEQAIQALAKDIHVLSEVTAATTLEDCRTLLQAAKNSKAQYMMAENYCYFRENIAIRNMVEAGLFGEIYYAEGEYLHNVRDLHYDAQGNPTWRRKNVVTELGCTYGTHSLGPILEWFDERIKSVNCLGSGAHTVPDYESDDTTIMLCQTESGKLIKIRLDMVSNRPKNAKYYTLQGTKGCYEAPRFEGGEHRIWLKDDANSSESWRPLADMYTDFLPAELRDPMEEAKQAGHDGSDYFLVKEFVENIREQKPVRIGIYKALEFTLPGILSEQSIINGGKPIDVPDVRTW